MKPLINTFIISFVFILTAYCQETNYTEVILPVQSPKTTIEQTIGLTNFTLSYNRPSKKGRVIFGDLVPFGSLWRTGANANTTIESNKSFLIGNEKIAPGKYAVFTIPNKENWEVIFYSKTNGWGVPRQFDESNVVLRTTVKTKHIENTIESFSINFTDITSNNVNLNLEWENTRVTIPINLETENQTVKNIDSFLNPHELNYRRIAFYLISEGIELEKSLGICDQIIEKNKGRFSGVWGYHFKAVAYKKLNKLKESKKQINLGKEYVKSLKDLSDEDKKEITAVLEENKMI